MSEEKKKTAVKKAAKKRARKKATTPEGANRVVTVSGEEKIVWNRGKDGRALFPYTHSLQQSQFEQIPIYAPLSLKQEAFLNDHKHDVIVWGGAAAAGKTQLSLLRMFINAYWDENFTGGIARKTQRQMKQAGSLFSTGSRMFRKHDVGVNRLEMAWNFPIGSEVRCHHLDNNPDDWQGGQFTEILIDEAQQCREDDVWYLTSRLRSGSEKRSQLIMTCNPDSSSFLASWLKEAGYVDKDTGLPIKEMDGVTTYMVQVAGKFEWYSTRKEIEQLYGKAMANSASAFVFYSANVYDNPYIRRYVPEYVSKLENLKETERRRLLDGDWNASEGAQGFFDGDSLNEVLLRDVPLETPRVRAWDLAGTRPRPTYPNPDWTRGVLATYNKETGDFYILDVKSMRDIHAKVQALIETTADEDGRDVYVVIPVDAGVAGSIAAEQKKSRLMHMGHRVLLETTRQSKLKRAEPFIIAVQEGKVHFVKGSLTKEDIEELSNFDGGKNNGHKDDLMDAIASCYNTLTSRTLVPTIKIGAAPRRALMGIGGSTLLG